MRSTRRLVALGVSGLVAACAQRPRPADDHAAEHARHVASDTAFAALQQRGQLTMGVDQYTSTHRFDPLPDGGRIALQRDTDDSAGAARIRAHLREIASRFASGDFSDPSFVHASASVPGTRVMAEKRSAIRFQMLELPRGGEVRLTTLDPLAVAAIHEFLAFQRSDHRVQAKGSP